MICIVSSMTTMPAVVRAHASKPLEGLSINVRSMSSSVVQRASPARLMLDDDAPHNRLLALQLRERRDIVPRRLAHCFGWTQIPERGGRNGGGEARENAERNPE